MEKKTRKNYVYEDNKGNYHLIINGKKVISGRKIYVYNNRYYEYEDRKGIRHIIKNGKEVAIGKRIYVYNRGYVGGGMYIYK